MIDLEGKRVMVYPGPTDFRYGIDGLSLLVGEREEGVVYAFCGKSGKSLKFLEFEKDAAWLTQAKIARGRFPFPEGRGGAADTRRGALRHRRLRARRGQGRKQEEVRPDRLVLNRRKSPQKPREFVEKPRFHRAFLV